MEEFFCFALIPRKAAAIRSLGSNGPTEPIPIRRASQGKDHSCKGVSKLSLEIRLTTDAGMHRTGASSTANGKRLPKLKLFTRHCHNCEPV